jgi:hypothetical protein
MISSVKKLVFCGGGVEDKLAAGGIPVADVAVLIFSNFSVLSSRTRPHISSSSGVNRLVLSMTKMVLE